MIKTWTDWHQRHGQENIKPGSFQSLDTIQSRSLNMVSDSTRIAKMRTICQSLEYNPRVVSWTVCSWYWNFSYIEHSAVLSHCVMQTWKVAKYIARPTQATGGGICNVSFLLEQWLCQLYVHLRRQTSPICQAISMSGCCISEWLTFKTISACNLSSLSGLWLDWSPVCHKILYRLVCHAIPPLVLSCPLSGFSS